MTAELKEIGLTGGEAEYTAQDRSKWRLIVDTLCPTADKKDYVSNVQFLKLRLSYRQSGTLCVLFCLVHLVFHSYCYCNSLNTSVMMFGDISFFEQEVYSMLAA